MEPRFRVLLISDAAPQLPERVERALVGIPSGAVALLLRRKDLGAGALLELARTLRPLTRALCAPLLISDRVDVALAAGADGVHLPESGIAPADARALLGPEAYVGISRHDAAGLARSAGASYVTLSPVHAVPGKGEPLTIAGFAALASVSPVAPFALGGVGADHVPALQSAGARGVAVIREVWGASDPNRALRTLLRAFAPSHVAMPGDRG